MKDDLTRLAEEGRAAKDKLAVERKKKAKAEKKARQADPDAPQNILARSIRGKVPLWLWICMGVSLLVVSVVPVFIAPKSFFGHSLDSDQASTLIGASVAVMAMVGTAVWLFVVQRVTGKESLWIAKLPFRFDVKSYEAVMSRREFHQILTLAISFKESQAGPQLEVSPYAKLKDALHGGDARNVKSSSERRYTVSSPKLDTWFVGDESSNHSNHKVHQWFRDYVEQVLMPIHAVAPIEEVRVSSRED